MEANLRGYNLDAQDVQPELELTAAEKRAKARERVMNREQAKAAELREEEKAELKEAKQGHKILTGLAKYGKSDGRGRPSKQRKNLTDGERFLESKDELLKELRDSKINPRKLKVMIRDRENNGNETMTKKGSKLWMEILLRRGELREANKRKAKVTVYDGVACYEYPDGLHFEVPAGFRMGKGIMDQELKIFIEEDFE